MTGEQARHRLLIPIDATGDARRGIGYAIHLARRSEAVEAFLLHIVPPVRKREVLRSRREQEIQRHVQTQSGAILDKAAAPLRAAGIPCKTCFRETEPVFGILDLAEQFDCTMIVIPKPDWLTRVTRGIARDLRNAQRSIPVVLIRADGSIEH